MGKPFGVISDLHLHSWSSFSSADPDGVNSRLRGLLNEIERCASEVDRAGGNVIVCAGDVFHVRGSVDPMVLNPALETFKRIVDQGFEIYMISGNHDLASKTSSDLSSAITALREVGVKVVSDPAGQWFPELDLVMIPWVEDLTDFRKLLAEWSEEMANEGLRERIDLVIHAPIDGVIKGLPEKGLKPAELAALGFNRVFAGHYHNHVTFEDGKVISIGALAHHTWSDPGSKAGFLIVEDESVRWMKSHLPEFIDTDQLAGVSSDDIPLLMDGNYVRIKTDKTKTSEIEALRAEALSFGARGVIIQATKKAEATREGTSAVTAAVSAGASLGASVAEFVKTKSYVNPERVIEECTAALDAVEMEEE